MFSFLKPARLVILYVKDANKQTSRRRFRYYVGALTGGIPLKLGLTKTSLKLDPKFAELFEVPLDRQRRTRSLIGIFFRSLRISVRCLVLVCLFAPLFAVYPLIKWNDELRRRWWRIVLFVLRRSGPIFVKFGQWASTRRDLFSSQFCDMFGELHSVGTVHSWSYSEKLLKLTFGEDWRLIFPQVDEKPCGSGCVAQVYKATLNSHDHKFLFDETDGKNGKSGTVAIKILHPNIEEAVDTDLAVLRAAVFCVQKLFRSAKCIDLARCLDEFEKTLIKQIDLRYEAESLRKFRSNFLSDSRVVFPKPLFDSPCILVETFENGRPISEYIGSFDVILKSDLARWGADILLKMIFEDNFVHADLHPGNILVQDFEFVKEESKFVALFKKLFNLPKAFPIRRKRMVFLDTGLTVKLKEHDLMNLRSVFRAVIEKNGERVANLLLTQAPQQNCDNPELFSKEIDNLIQTAFHTTVSLAQINVSSLLTNLLDVVSRHRVNLEPNFTCIVLSVLVLEGLGRTLDSELDLIKYARKFLLKI